MSAFGNDIIHRELNTKQKPEVLVLKSNQILADPQIYAELDLLTVSTQDLNSFQNRHFVSVNKVSERLLSSSLEIHCVGTFILIIKILFIFSEWKMSWYCSMVRLSI